MPLLILISSIQPFTSAELLSAPIRAGAAKFGIELESTTVVPTCATQLLNAGCRVTSIQRFLGHKELASTMIYARAHDQTVAEDYFTAMQRVEQRLEIVPAEQKDSEVVKVQEPTKVMHLIERLELPELCFEERLDITLQL